MKGTIFFCSLIVALGAGRATAATWDLDPLFGSGGIARSQLRASSDSPEAIARQADAKLVVAGSTGSNIAVARFNDDGAPDPTFGDAGVTEIDIGFNARTTAVGLQSDGRVLVSGWVDLVSADEFFLARLLPSGQLDIGFGSAGVVRTPIGTSDAQANAMAIRSDDRIVLAGGAGGQIALAGYLADGSPDGSFGSDGIVTTALPGSAKDAALQSDGKIVVAGFVDFGSPGPVASDLLVARYDTDGTLDAGFGVGGIVATDLGSTSESADAIAIDSGGRIVVAGLTQVAGSQVFALARYLTDGTLDALLDGDGIVTTAIGSLSRPLAVRIQGDGKLVAAGESYDGNRMIMALTRYDDDGSLDTSFDGDGIVTLAIGSDASPAVDLLIDPNGRLVAVAPATFQADADLTVIRLNSDATFDTSFDTDGIAAVTVGNSGEAPFALALQDDGKFVVGGFVANAAMIARLDADGSLDPTFGRGGGVTTTCGSSSNCWIKDVVVQPDGRIVAAGTRQGLASPEFVLLRHDADGTPDASFGANGVVVGPAGIAQALLRQPDGKLIVAGYRHLVGGAQVVVARFDASGAPDPSFDGDGVVQTDLGILSIMFGAALQPDGKILVAGGQPGFSVVRYNSDGSLDTSFDGDGVVFTAADFSAFGIAVQADGKIVVAGGASGFTLVRYNGDGSIDPSFSGGIVELDGLGYGRDVVLQPDGKLLVVGHGAEMNVARLNPDGSLDSSFGILGVVKVDSTSSAWEEAWSIVLQPDGKAVLAGLSGEYDIVLARLEMASCGVAPAASCRSASLNKLLVKDSANDDADRLVWKWLKGDATALADIANPTQSFGGEPTAYRLCVYGTPAPAAVAVGSGPPWVRIGERGFKYTDATAAHDGAWIIRVLTGSDGKAKVVFKARGAGMPELAPPLATPVTLQLIDRASGTCWESVFQASDMRLNQPGKLKGHRAQ